MQIFKTALSSKAAAGFHTDYGSPGISPPHPSSVFPPLPLNFVFPLKFLPQPNCSEKLLISINSLTPTLYFFKINISLIAKNPV